MQNLVTVINKIQKYNRNKKYINKSIKIPFEVL